MTDLDTTFNTPNGYVTTDFDAIPTINSLSEGKAIALQPNGKIVMAGNYDNLTIPQIIVAVCRYNSNGTLDTTFGGLGTGKVTVPIQTNNVNVTGITLQSDGKIVICGTIYTLFKEIFVMRLTSAGILDTSAFGAPNGYVITTSSQFTAAYSPILAFDNCEANSVTMQTIGVTEYIVIGGAARGQVLPAGPTIDYYALARYTLSGSLDTSFGSSSGLVAQSFNPPSGQVGLTIYADSTKILLAGNKLFGTFLRMTVVKFSGIGILDSGFGSGGITNIPNFFPQSQDQANAIVLQSDGKIVLGGSSINQSSPSQRCFVLARLLATGLIDTTYGTSGVVITDLSPSYNLDGNTMGIQPDNKIILGGTWDILYTSPASFALARYLTNGLLDTTFGVAGTGLILQDIDPTVNYIETGYSLAIQPDGKILMGGILNENLTESGPKRFILARYLSVQTPPIPTPIVPICFPAGTPVTTDQGDINIELIDPNVHTIFNRKIIAITETIMLENNIVCFEKNSLGYNIPNKKTYISNYHGIIHNNKLIQAHKFVGRLPGVYYNKYNNEILYNILMEKHYIIKINNMRVETLNPINFVAQLYTKNYTPEEKTKLILEMNKKTAELAYIKYNSNQIRNIKYTKRNYNQKIIPNYFITQLHTKTIKNYHMIKTINSAKPFTKLHSITIGHKPVMVKNIHRLSRSNKRLRR